MPSEQCNDDDFLKYITSATNKLYTLPKSLAVLGNQPSNNQDKTEDPFEQLDIIFKELNGNILKFTPENDPLKCSDAQASIINLRRMYLNAAHNIINEADNIEQKKDSTTKALKIYNDNFGIGSQIHEKEGSITNNINENTKISPILAIMQGHTDNTKIEGPYQYRKYTEEEFIEDTRQVHITLTHYTEELKKLPDNDTKTSNKGQKKGNKITIPIIGYNGLNKETLGIIFALSPRAIADISLINMINDAEKGTSPTSHSSTNASIEFMLLPISKQRKLIAIIAGTSTGLLIFTTPVIAYCVFKNYEIDFMGSNTVTSGVVAGGVLLSLLAISYIANPKATSESLNKATNKLTSDLNNADKNEREGKYKNNNDYEKDQKNAGRNFLYTLADAFATLIMGSAIGAAKKAYNTTLLSNTEKKIQTMTHNLTNDPDQSKMVISQINNFSEILKKRNKEISEEHHKNRLNKFKKENINRSRGAISIC